MIKLKYSGVDDAIDGLLTLVMARIERSLEEERRRTGGYETGSRRKSLRLPESLSGNSRRLTRYNSNIDLNRHQNDSSCSSC